MSLGLYSIGFALVIGGLTYGAYLLLIPTRWIVVGAVVLIGAGIVCWCPATEQPESPNEDCYR